MGTTPAMASPAATASKTPRKPAIARAGMLCPKYARTASSAKAPGSPE
jgi:hypothetical protein